MQNQKDTPKLSVTWRLKDWHKFNDVSEEPKSTLSTWYYFIVQHDNGAENVMIIARNVDEIYLHEENNIDTPNRIIKPMGLQAGVWVGHWLSIFPFVTFHVAGIQCF